MMDIEKHLLAHGDRPYLIEAATGATLTYAEFAEAVWDLADVLKCAGLGHGSRVAAMLPNGTGYACLYFACLVSGAVAVPVNVKYAPEDREYILETSGADCLACCEATVGLAPARFLTDGNVLWFGDAAPARSLAVWPLPDRAGLGRRKRPAFAPDPAALFSLTFTSGTTGRPKGIFHTPGTLFANALAFGQALGITPEHRFYHMMPMSYMAGLLNSLLCPFAAGASVVVDREFDARMAFSFWETPARHSVNCMWASPSALAMVQQLDRGTLGAAYAQEHLRFIASCTAALRPEVQASFEARYGVAVLPSFGMSETLINTLDRPERRCAPNATGFSLPSMSLRICDEQGTPLPAGEPGEVFVHSPSLMAGYLDPKTGGPLPTPEGGWFPTGDLGVLDPDGALRITDRKKDVIIRGGINISPQKVEDVLAAHPAVAEASVVGVPDEARGERVVAALRLHGRQEQARVIAEALELCRDRLESMAWPETLTVMDDFPRSSTGKVDKMRLRAILGGQC